MKRFLDLPIHSKLFGLILISSCTALLLTWMTIVLYDTIDYANRRLSDLRTQAEMLGSTSTAALTFNDAKSATEYLAALKAKPAVIAAALYRADGSVLATYSKNKEARIFPKAHSPGQDIEAGYAVLFKNIVENGETIGSVYLYEDLNRLPRALQFAGIVSLMMAISLGTALWISRKLQTVISEPILEISAVANAVIGKKDYTLRAHQYYDDEIGALALAFNKMLSHIQEWDTQLNNINESLRKEIEGRKQAQEALKTNMQELARSNSELEQFAYVSSHDLQEPLRMVASYTQLLEQRYSDKFDDKGRVFLFHIVDGAKRMQQLIDDLLMFSRVGTRHRELLPIDSQQSLKIALLNLKKSIEENNTKLTINELPTVMADPIQLVQLFQNLLSNAIKFKSTQAPHIEISAKRQNSFWQFAVKDNGIGIDKEHFERIFVVFQRLHGRSEYSGTGIGLAICKKIVEFHGGKIWVESEPEQGATFYFTLRGTT